MNEDYSFLFDAKMLEARSSIFHLNQIGFKLSDKITELEDINSSVNTKKFQIDEKLNESEKKNIEEEIYKDALKKLEELMKSNKDYFLIYELSEKINKKLLIKDYNLDELIHDVLSLLEAIREGKIIISDEDRYLIEKTFKTIYEVLKIAYVAKKDTKIFEEVKKNNDIVPYINEQIKEEVDNVKNPVLYKDIKEVMDIKKVDKDDLLDLDVILSVAVVTSPKYTENEKEVIMDKVIAKVDNDQIEVLDDIVENKDKVLVKEMKKEENTINPITKGIEIGVITSSVLGNTKFDKVKSEELVIGDEEIVEGKRGYEDYTFNNPIFNDSYDDQYTKDEDDKLYTLEDYNNSDKPNFEFVEYRFDDNVDFTKFSPKLLNQFNTSKNMFNNMLKLGTNVMKTLPAVGKAALLCGVIGAANAGNIVNFINTQSLGNKVLGLNPIAPIPGVKGMIK